MNDGEAAGSEPAGDKKGSDLSQFGRDLNEWAKKDKVDPVIGREQEISRVIQILSRRTKNNPVLIGAPGVGKTAIAEGLAQRIITGNVPDSLQNKRVFSLDLASIVAGTKYRGEFEERIKRILDTISRDDTIILFIDEIHQLIGAGAVEGAMDAANILKPALARGDLQCIGATTADEYKKHFEKDAALARRFQPSRSVNRMKKTPYPSSSACAIGTKPSTRPVSPTKPYGLPSIVGPLYFRPLPAR